MVVFLLKLIISNWRNEMKLKCSKCGKKEAVVIDRGNMSNFASAAWAPTIKSIVELVMQFNKKYIVCKSCGHHQEL